MTQVQGGGVVLRPEDARHVSMGPFDVTFLATRAETGGAFALIETLEKTPSGGPPLHIHRDAAESFYVIDGAYLMHLDGDDYECPAGSFVYIPQRMPHTFRALEPGSRKLNLYTPAAMEGYFEDLAASIAAGANDGALEEIAERYEMEVLGPPPPDYLTPRG